MQATFRTSDQHIRTCREAFTLIELLIVMAIISILAAIALINMLEAQTRSKVARSRADLRALMTALESYRTDFVDYPPTNLVPPLGSAPNTFRPLDARRLPPPGKTPPGYHDGYPAVPVYLTTPIAYITSSPREVFRDHTEPGSNVYRFKLTNYGEQLANFSYFHIISQNKWFDYYEQGIYVPLIAVNQSQSEVWNDRYGFPARFNVGAFSKYGEWVLIGAGPDRVFADWRIDLTYVFYPGYNYQVPISLGLRRPTTPPWGYSFDVPYDPTNGTISFGNLILTQLGMSQPATRSTLEDDTPAIPRDVFKNDEETNSIPPARDATVDRDRRTREFVSTSDASMHVREETEIPATSNSANSSATTPLGPSGLTKAVAKVRDAEAEKVLLLDDPPSTTGRVRSFAWLLLILALLLLLWALERWWNRGDSALKQARVRIGAGTSAAHDDLKELEELDLSHSDISDEGMRLLAGLPRLENLCLWDTLITDIGINELHSLENLRTLNLSETQVSDAGMTNLERFPALHTLILTETAVSDAAIPELLKLTKLHNLALRGTQITPEGLAQLREALPRCAITHFLDDSIRPLSPALDS